MEQKDWNSSLLRPLQRLWHQRMRTPNNFRNDMWPYSLYLARPIFLLNWIDTIIGIPFLLYDLNRVWSSCFPLHYRICKLLLSKCKSIYGTFSSSKSYECLVVFFICTRGMNPNCKKKISVRFSSSNLLMQY